MIKYNIRKNGPWEYDKFCLNYYNLYNELLLKQKHVIDSEASQLNIDKTYQDFIDKDTTGKLYTKKTYLY